MKNRIKKIFGYISNELDAIIIKNSISPYIDPSFFYVTGLDAGLFENSVAILYHNGESEILTSKIESGLAKGCSLTIFEGNKELKYFLTKKLRGKKIGVNFKGVTHNDFLCLQKILGNKLIDVSTSIQQSRMRKDNLEMRYLRKACEIASKVADRIPNMLKIGIRESDVAGKICYQIHKEKASLAFHPIVAFGKNSSRPHYTYGTKKLEGGLALFDFGARYKCYCSDITRTFFYGKVPKKIMKMYEAVQGAQEIAFDIMKPGVKVGDIHRQVEVFIQKRGFGKLIHSTGHSIGLSVHDGEVLHPRSDIVLEEGMVFTVEPGIYLPDIGGVRLEDDVVIQADGIEILTRTKNLFELKPRS